MNFCFFSLLTLNLRIWATGARRPAEIHVRRISVCYTHIPIPARIPAALEESLYDDEQKITSKIVPNKKNDVWWPCSKTREVAQWVKYLLPKSGDLSLDLKLDTRPEIPRRDGRWRQENPLKLMGHLETKMWTRNPTHVILNTEKWELTPQDTPSCSLCSPF